MVFHECRGSSNIDGAVDCARIRLLGAELRTGGANAGCCKRRFRWLELRSDPCTSLEKKGAVIGDEPRVLEKSWWPDVDDEVSEEVPTLEPGLVCLTLFSS